MVCVGKDEGGNESYYPVNDEKNAKIYIKYKELAEREKRLALVVALVSISIIIWIL